jgi:hypothetical protein
VSVVAARTPVAPAAGVSPVTAGADEELAWYAPSSASDVRAVSDCGATYSSVTAGQLELRAPAIPAAVDVLDS